MKFAVMLLALLSFASHAWAEDGPRRLSVRADETHWSGIYAGLQSGQGHVEQSQGGFDLGRNDVALNGLIFGHQRLRGWFVTGLELDVNEVREEGSDLRHNLVRLKTRVGLELGRYHPYALIGTAIALPDKDFIDSPGQGLVFGLGGEVAITDHLALGVEYTRHDFRHFSGYPDLSVKADSLQIRTVFHF